MVSGKGIDGKREIFYFQDIYLLTKILDSGAFKHMTGYKRVLADLDLLFLKCTHLTLPHAIWTPKSNEDI